MPSRGDSTTVAMYLRSVGKVSCSCTVSYTHLDVYKRQIRYGCPVLLKGGHLEGDCRDVLAGPDPCTDCARAIIQSGIKMVVTHEVKIDENTPQNTWRDKLAFSEQMFREAGIEYLTLPREK